MGFVSSSEDNARHAEEAAFMDRPTAPDLNAILVAKRLPGAKRQKTGSSKGARPGPGKTIKRKPNPQELDDLARLRRELSQVRISNHELRKEISRLRQIVRLQEDKLRGRAKL